MRLSAALGFCLNPVARKIHRVTKHDAATSTRQIAAPMKLEHSKLAYKADFAFYIAAVIGLAVYLILSCAGKSWVHNSEVLFTTAIGLGSWSLIEYLLHRFVLHGLQPFKGWHLEHHARPTALIAAPTLLSSWLIFALVFLPVWLWLGLQNAAAFTLGVLMGYLSYAFIHHGMHHWRAKGAWLAERKRWHALHHSMDATHAFGRFGVSTSFWDRVFANAPAR
jgi:hypothetical protein